MSLRRIRDLLTDPVRFSLVVLVALALTGLVVLSLTWRGVTDQSAVSDQVAFVTSGGLSGLALVGVSMGMLMIQARRLSEARRRAEMERAVRIAAGLIDVVHDDRTDTT